MGDDDTFGDVEAEAQASSIILADLPEALEDRVQHVGGYPRAGVIDGEANEVSGPRADDPDPTPLRCELDRVREEIGEHLEHPIVVEVCRERGLGELDVE